MAQALFINAEYIKSVSIIDENVDEKILKVSIKKAQDFRIHRVLGTTLYNKFTTDINSSGSSGVTGVYKTLMDSYIIPALVEWTLYEAALWLNYKYRNKAIAAQSSENAQPVDLTVLQSLRDEHKNAAEWYTERLIRYLCENEASYPEYDNNPDGDDIQSQTSNYDSPIWLGGGSCGCNYKDETIDLI